MKSVSKKMAGLLIGAALLSAACGEIAQKPAAEFATMPMYEYSYSQPAKVVRHDDTQSITGSLSDCASQLDRIRDCFSASIGHPHR